MRLIQLQPRAAGDLHLIKSKNMREIMESKKNKKIKCGGWGRGRCGVRFSLLSLSVTSFRKKINSRNFGGEDQNSCFHVRRRGSSSGRPDAAGEDSQLLWVPSTSLEPTRLPRSISRQARRRPPLPPPPHWMWNSLRRSTVGRFLSHRSGCLSLVTLNASRRP